VKGVNIFGVKKQSCPTLEDLKNEKLRRLAKRLTRNSEKETLTNILEWEDRNMQYWKERFIFPFIIIFIVIVVFVTLIPCKLLLWKLLLIVAVSVSAVVLIYLIASYWLHFRGYQVSIKRLLIDTFQFSLSVEKILKYRLAVCRDYAKLTAALLLNIYPESEVYFIAVPLHVAVMVKLQGKYYALDKKLPVLTLSRWLKANRHLTRLSLRKIANVYASKLIRDSEGKPLGIEFKKCERIPILDFSEEQVNTEKLTKEVAKLLKINQMSQEREPDFKITIPNFANYFEDDEIVMYSMARAIKLKLENELCSNFENIEKIEIKQDGVDLIVFTYLRNK